MVVALSCRLYRFVNLFFLRDMHAHKHFDRFDCALRIAQQIAIDCLRVGILGDAAEQARQVQYFAVRAAHGRQPSTIAGQEPRDRRIDVAFVVALMRNHLLLNDRVGFVDQSDGGLGRSVVKRVGDVAQAIKAMTKRDVIVPQLLTGRGRKDARASAHGRVQRPQGVDNDGDVDQFLNERRRHRRDKAEHRRNHGEAG